MSHSFWHPRTSNKKSPFCKFSQGPNSLEDLDFYLRLAIYQPIWDVCEDTFFLARSLWNLIIEQKGRLPTSLAERYVGGTMNPKMRVLLRACSVICCWIVGTFYFVEVFTTSEECQTYILRRSLKPLTSESSDCAHLSGSQFFGIPF